MHCVACAQHGGRQKGPQVEIIQREQQRRVQLPTTPRRMVFEALCVEAQHGGEAPDGHLLHSALTCLAPGAVPSTSMKCMTLGFMYEWSPKVRKGTHE